MLSFIISRSGLQERKALRERISSCFVSFHVLSVKAEQGLITVQAHLGLFHLNPKNETLAERKAVQLFVPNLEINLTNLAINVTTILMRLASLTANKPIA